MAHLNRQQLIELVNKIRNVEYDTEEDYDAAIVTFLDNVPDPAASNLIFYYKPKLTTEEIVDKALAYKPIILGPPPSEHK
jgi:hypothetical protein